jgi:hypothetical protein
MTPNAQAVTTHGDFAIGEADVLSRLRIEFFAVDAITEWSRCSMVADFVAQFVAANFDDRDSARMILSTLVNELVENGVKFSSRPLATVALTLLHLGDTLRVEVRNTTDAERVQRLSSWLGQLEAKDADKLFLERLEEPPGGIGRGSGIGLLILKKDYGARIAARVAPDGDSFVVDMQVTLNAEELEQR